MSDGATTVIVGIQLLLAATFVAAATVALRRGKRAQAAAESKMGELGHDVVLLGRHQIRFEESAVESLLPYGIAAVLTVVAVLNASNDDAGRVMAWVVQPLLLLGGGVITYGQVFADRYVVKALGSDGVPAADAAAVVGAARSEFPGWLRPLVVGRFLLTTLGSIAVIVLLIGTAATAP